MLTDALLEQLRFKGEGSDLDYKAERYKFAGASDEDKSELLKDVLAMANAHRDGTGYLLLGFKENAPYPAEVLGLAAEGAIDDSRLQQFVNSKLESKLDFRYEERVFDGKTIGVLSIPKQTRPFYLSKPYGKLSKDTVYIRRGSSTDIASLREVATMGLANATRPAAQVALEWLTAETEALPSSFDLEFYRGEVRELPDYSSPPRYEDFGTAFIPTMHDDNRSFWRELASYVRVVRRLVRVRLRMTNRSEFPLTGAKLEIHVAGPMDGKVRIFLEDDLPEVPVRSTNRLFQHVPTNVRLPNSEMEVDDRDGRPLCRIKMGTVLPGESFTPNDDIAALPDAPGRYVLKARLLAQELNPPILFEHEFEVTGDDQELTVEALERLVAPLRPKR